MKNKYNKVFTAKSAILAIVIALAGTGIANADNDASNKITSFVILPIPDPANYDIKKHRASIPVIDREARKTFTDLVKKNNPDFGLLMWNTLRTELIKAGLTEVLAPTVSIDQYNPRAINYQDLKTDADAIVHLYFESAGVRAQKMEKRSSYPYGMTSEPSDEDYQPYLYAGYCVVLKNLGNGCQLENSAAFGDGITVDGNIEYPAKESEHWRTSDEVLANIPNVIGAYKTGSVKMAKGISEKIISYPGK
jgi:hypothetical protein